MTPVILFKTIGGQKLESKDLDVAAEPQIKQVKIVTTFYSYYDAFADKEHASVRVFGTHFCVCVCVKENIL